MMDFSWSELLIVVVVSVLAVGPKQLPEVLHGLGKLFRRMQYMKYALTRQFDDFMDQADLKELKNPSTFLQTDIVDETEDDEEFISSLPAQNPQAKPQQQSLNLETKPDDQPGT